MTSRWGQRLAGQMSPNESWVLLCRWRQRVTESFAGPSERLSLAEAVLRHHRESWGLTALIWARNTHHYRNDSSCLTCNLCIKGFEAALSGTSDRWKEQLCFLLTPWWRNVAHEVGIMRAVVLYICAFRLLLM